MKFPINIYTVSSITAAVICWLLAIRIYSGSKTYPVRKSFARVTLLIGIWTLFPFISSLPVANQKALFLVRLIYISAIFVPSTFFSFIFYMLELTNIKIACIILRISYMVAICFLSASFSSLFIADIERFMPQSAIIPGPLYVLFIIYFVFMYLYASIKLLWKYKKSTGHSRSQLKYIGLAFAIATIAGLAHFLSAFKIKEVFPHDILVAIYSLIMAYAIARYRLMDITIALTRTAILLIVYGIIFSVSLVLSTIFKASLKQLIGEKWWLIPASVYTIAITLAPFLYLKLQKGAEARLLKNQRHHHGIIATAARNISLIRDLDKVLKLLAMILTKTLGITSVGVYLLDRAKKQFRLRVSRGSKNSEAAVDIGTSLVKYLQGVRRALVYEEIRREYDDKRDIFIKEIRDTMIKINADLLIPSFVEDELVGFLALGPKKLGEAYTVEDIDVLTSLANQSALAIENAQFLKEREEMQGKLREVETLTTIRDLLGSFNHEIYNLLTPVSGTLQGINMGNYEKRPEKMRSDVERSIEITFFIKTYLGWVREYVESGDKIAAYQLSELINGGISYSKDKLEKQNIKTQVDVDPKIFIVGYPSLPLIFRHLVIHSIYGYGMEQNGAINITARILENGATIEIIQIDTGDDLTKYLEDGSTMGGKKFAEKGKLGGVSYFIAQAVVSKHKGIFKVEPTGGKGTKFNIRLPLDFNKVSA